MKQAKKPVSKKAQHIHQPAVKQKPAPVKALVIGCAVIAVIAFIVFSPCLTGEFLSWDDFNYIRDNALIRVFSMSNIIHIFNYKTIVVGNYHPLTVLSYVIEYQFAGINPFLYHLDNLLLHLLNIALICRMMWLLTKKTYATLIATALFALHPMRVESVVWAAERKDVLYTLFFLLSLILYIHFLLKTRRNNQYYIASIACFILSILSKGQAVVLPLTLILIDYWYDRKITLRSVTNKVPYLFFSLASGILAIVAQHSSLTEQRLQAHSLFERLAIAAFNITAYLYKLVFPFDLSCFYKYPASQNMWWVYAGALTAIVVVAAVAILFRKNRIVVFGSLFFLFTVFIVSQILPVGNAIIADRYTYVPYIGLFFIAAMFLDKLITGKSPYSRYFIILPAVILVVFSIKSYAQSTTWHDDFTLYRNALKQDPDNGMAASNLGRAYIDKEDYKTAIEYFNLAIKNEDTFIENFHAYQNLGVVSSRMGNDREAIKYFSTAYARNRSSVDAVFSRGLSYTSLGKLDSAVTDFTTILTSMDSLNTKTYYSRGIAFNKLNMPDRAIADYSAAIRIDPDYCDPYVNRGNIYFAHNSFDAAVADYNKALSLVPDDGNTYLNRSFVYFKMKNYKNALDDALKAQEYKKEVNPNYLNDLRKALKTP